MHRFYTENVYQSENKAVISGDDVKHMKKVLRLKEGDRVTVCDFKCIDYICEIVSLCENEAVLKIESSHKNAFEPPVNVTIYQGLPKSDKLEYIIQKCIELGAVKIVPTVTKRTVVKISDGEKKRARWQKIADEAAKQCGRGVRVEVDLPVTFEKAVLSANESLKIMPYENEEKNTLKSVLKNSDEKNISIFIGPEGGFDQSEVDFAKQNGVFTVTLGPRIMRTETAPIAVLSACMYEKDGWER